jgi:hypothetical protein
MNEAHCLNAVRYLASNQAPARLSAAPGAWPWSSVRAHLRGRDDALVSVRPLLELAPNFAELLALSPDEQRELESFASRSANGRPLKRPAVHRSRRAQARPHRGSGKARAENRSMSRAETGIVYHVPVTGRRRPPRPPPRSFPDAAVER